MHETERRIQILANPFVRQRHVPFVVGIVDLETGRPAVRSLQVLTIRQKRPSAGEEVLVAAKRGRGVCGVDTRQPAARAIVYRIPADGTRMAPSQDSVPMFCLSRATPIVVCAAVTSGVSFVAATSPPKFARPILPIFWCRQ